MANIKHIVQCLLPTKDLKDSEYQDITVIQEEMKLGKINPTFTVKVPKILYDSLVDSEKQYRSFATMQKEKNERAAKFINDNNIKNPDEYLKKSYSGCLISILLDVIKSLTSDVVLKNTKEETQKEKKIFISFNHSSIHDREENYGGYMGKKITSSFQFFIGYKVFEKKNIYDDNYIGNYYTYIVRRTGSLQHLDTNLEEGDHLHPFHSFNNKSRGFFENTYNIIDWTEEAEEFLKKTQEHFEVLYGNLYEFLGNIDDNKMKMLIEQNPLKLLNS